MISLKTVWRHPAWSALLTHSAQLLAFALDTHKYPSLPEPDAEAEEKDDDSGGEDGVGDAADAGQDLDAEQVEPAAVEQSVIHGVALQMVVL